MLVSANVVSNRRRHLAHSNLRKKPTRSLAQDNAIGFENIQKQEKALLAYANEKLLEIEGLKIYGTAQEKTSVISFNQTFTVTTPGTYRLAIINSGSTGGGNVRISVDDFAENATVIGCVENISLPVKLTNFGGNLNSKQVDLHWAVDENEDDDHFEVEKSTDGKEFTTAAIVMASEKAGSENYSFAEIMKSEKIYYRLRMFDKNKVVTFSNTLIFETKTVVNAGGLRIVNNPATDKLSLSFTSANNQSLEIKVYDLSGRMQMNQKVNVYEGNNLINLPLASAFSTGIYAVEVSNGHERLTSKFVKQ